MIRKALFYQTDNTYPYRNLAVEEFLMKDCGDEECILYLWQNRHTVVIGKNQNCWKECRVSQLEKDDGYLVRRLSGGGAVYHDMGNLNFTFLVRKGNYDVDRQMSVIIRAMQLMGLKAEKSGRNDALIDGRKFSGNAFYERNDFCYHHGTLLLDVNKQQMSKYLNVSADKLKSKGVESVRSRVANLCEFYPGVTVELVSAKLREAFGEIYGLEVADYDTGRFRKETIEEYENRFASWEWKYGRRIPFQYEFGRRFEWGDVQLQLEVNEGIIKNANVFSDSMDPEWAAELAEALPGCRYEQQAMCEVADRLSGQIAADVKRLIAESV